MGEKQENEGCFKWGCLTSIIGFVAILIYGSILDRASSADFKKNGESIISQMEESAENEEWRKVLEVGEEHESRDEKVSSLVKLAKNKISEEKKRKKADARKLVQQEREAKKRAEAEKKRLAEEEKRNAELERLASMTPEEREQDLKRQLKEKIVNRLNEQLGSGKGLLGGGKKEWKDLDSIELHAVATKEGTLKDGYVTVKFKSRIGALHSIMGETSEIFEALDSFPEIKHLMAWSLVNTVDLKGQEHWSKGTIMELDMKTAREVKWENLHGERMFKMFETYGKAQKTRFVE